MEYNEDEHFDISHTLKSLRGSTTDYYNRHRVVLNLGCPLESITWETFNKYQYLCLTPEPPNQTIWEWGLHISTFSVSPEDSNVQPWLRTTDKILHRWVNKIWTRLFHLNTRERST